MTKQGKIILLIAVTIILLVIKVVTFFNQNNNTKNVSANSFQNTTHLILTKHAKCRMDCRHITEQEIKEIIHEGKVNYAKSGTGSKGDATYALEGYSNERQHLRIVVAPESDGLVIITCIDLDNEWACNCN